MNILAELEKTEGLEKTEAPEQTEELEVLYQRWEALNKTIGIYERRLDESRLERLQDFLKGFFCRRCKPGIEWASTRKKILLCLLKRLQAFADGHFNYFYNGFLTKELEISKKYPPGHVLSVILDQIGKDLDIIRRTATDITLSGNDLLTTTLTFMRADYLVLEALKPAAQLLNSKQEVTAHRLDLKQATVVNYFQRSAVNRVVPYDNDTIALFGIPFTTVDVPRDFLAIPHEVGHYVFWNGVVKGVPIWVKLGEDIENNPNISDWVKPWLEEIFADVYGCLVAGPVIALDFQDLQLLESEARFTQNDGAHPAPAVRPDIYNQVLKKNRLDDWATSLEKRWEKYRTKRCNPCKDNNIPLDSVRQDMEKVVDLVYNYLKDLNSNSDNWWGQFSSTKVTTEEPERLYRDFEDKITGLIWDNIPNKLSHEPEDCNIDGLYEVWSNNIIKVASQVVDSQVVGSEDRPEWYTIWLADGWSTRGPQSEN